MARLAGAVRIHAALQHLRRNARGYQQRRADDHAIDQNHAPLGRCLQHGSGHGGDLETAKRGQHIQRLHRIRMRIQHLLQHLQLALHAGLIQAGPRTGRIDQGSTEQARQDQRGRRGVANAHLAQHQHIARQRLHQLHAVADRLQALFARHRRASQAVLRAVGNLAHLQPVARGKIMRHAAIHHRQVDAVLACHHAHRRAIGQKVFHHLPGHVLRIGRHAALHQAMVAGADHHLRLHQHRTRRAQNAAQLQRQFFQPSQRAQRLGLGIVHGLQFSLQLRVVQIGNPGEKIGIVHRHPHSAATSSSCTAWPAGNSAAMSSSAIRKPPARQPWIASVFTTRSVHGPG